VRLKTISDLDYSKMPRKRKCKIEANQYKNYTEDQVKKAVAAVNKGMSLKEAENVHNVQMRTIKNK